ncbi:MAG TPA: hypothetical protein VMT42_01885 [candidate division Zixibacteria bacterium]|nr:hypothetical protein [candidate division Zixibacteria bacterium]
MQNAEGAVIAFCIEPGNLSVKEGDVFNVSVAVEDVPVNPGMESAEFHVSWDPTVLKGLSIVKVMFQDNSIGWDELNNTEGLLFYVHALCSDSIAGNQTLAIIAFEAIGQGSTSLHFTFVAACSPDSDKLNCESADGSVTVEKGNGASAPIASNKPENVLYTLTIIAGSASDRNTLILPPAIATEYVPFSVNIEIVNVTDMGAWEFGLCWNNSILNCTNAEIYNSNTWQTAISIDGEIDNNFNSTHGHYHIAVADAKEPYSGNITIATLTFNPVGAGTTPLTFDHVDVCDSDALKIKFSTTIGSITANEG